MDYLTPAPSTPKHRVYGIIPYLWRGTVRNINFKRPKSVAGSPYYSLSPAFIMAAEWQTLPGADVILRASGGREFHAHKLILSFASPVFRDMFSVPQSPTTESSQLPTIDVDDPPEALEKFLRIIYPTPNPPINNIETLASVIRLADKYGAEAVLDVRGEYLLSMCLDSPPVHTYAILCVCGREREAEAAARRVSFASLASLSSHPLLRLMTTEHYQRLVGFMVARDKRTREILNERRAGIQINHYCSYDAAHGLYSGALVTSLQVAFEANPCIQPAEALGVVLNSPFTFSPCGDSCTYNIRYLREFSELVLKDLVKMGEELPWEQ